MSFLRKKNKNNKVVYRIINVNQNTKDKECIEADTENQKIYRKIIGKAGNATKNWENTGVTLNLEVPHPPIPNNYDKLLLFRKQNVLRPAIEQSEATLYLHEQNYILDKDYNAYQAIELASKLKLYENNKEELISYNDNNDNLDIFSDKPKIKKNNSNMNLDIFSISPNIEKMRNIRNKRLSYQEDYNIQKNEIREDRSFSLGSELKKEDTETNINDKIFSFQMMSKMNNTRKNDLKPTNNNNQQQYTPSAPPLYLVDNN